MTATLPAVARPAPRARAPWGLTLVIAVAIAARLVALPGSTERSMDADGPHLLNVARCFERGQGFSNPAAWPAWMKPARLPMPETFKEPGYPWLIARLARVAGGEFRAAILISLFAGLLLPVALFALARALGLDPAEATLAALIAAASPLGIFMSVRVTVDSLFPALLTAAFALAAWRPAPRPAWADVATGIAAGLAFMARGQALVATPALAVLLAARRPRAGAWSGIAIAAVAAITTASPFIVRNLRLFGVPFYSDVGEYGLWPYVDHLTFSHGLARPPAPLGFALTHVPEVLRHMGESLFRFCVYALPGDILGNAAWLVPLAAGAVLALLRGWTFLPVALYLGATIAFIFAINWDARYWASTVPFWALIAALGAAWVARTLGGHVVAGPVRASHVLIAATAVTIAVQAEDGRRQVARFLAPEMDAAIAEAPFLRSHLEPGEAVMAVTTSFYSWFADRPSVHLVIADRAAFAATVRRLRVRYAALPTSRLAEFAARYPDGRLPDLLVPDHEDPQRDVTVFRVVDDH
ncbi:MAG: glycosyltransferase family 39 protein [Candidatus Eisenbacteria bacterium]|nr:glycosyltransferase family 39 protein [Candidatus Eisenbacteria bacterium]